MDETTVLFRPVGQKELDLIRESDFTAFPPLLPEQPIFYPVLNEHYAAQIAREWNAKHEETRSATQLPSTFEANIFSDTKSKPLAAQSTRGTGSLPRNWQSSIRTSLVQLR
jgi:hypothetical protein